MAKTKSRIWPPEAVTVLQNIPKGKNASKAIQKVATKHGRSYETTYQKWWALTRKQTSTASRKKSGSAPVMELTFDSEYEGRFTGITDVEQKAFEQGLEKWIPSMTPGRGAINVPKRFERVAKAYLNKYYPKYVFSFNTIAGNVKEKKLIRRV